jgi:hypothetical protein
MGYLGTKPANSPLTSELIPDGLIATSDIADNAITTAKIAAGAVVQADLAAGVAGTGPAFSAFKPASAGNQSITSGVPTIVTFGATAWNQGNCYSTSTNRFTPNVAGYYQIIVSIGPNLSITPPASVNIYISKNGDLANQTNYVGYRYFPVTSNSTNYIFGTSVMMYFNGTTDYVVVYFDNGSVLAGDASGGSDRTFFQAFLARAA